MDKAASGEIQPDSSYFFYRFFNFVGGVSLLLAIICAIYLIGLVISYTQKVRDPER